MAKADRVIQFHEITPVPAPRWPKRKFDLPRPVLNYIAFREELQSRRVWVPMHFAHIVFMLPMPKSWSQKKKLIHCYADHKQKPDTDNLLKSVYDSLLPDDDSHISRMMGAKVWAPFGGFLVADKAMFTDEKTHDVKMYLERLMTQAHGMRASQRQYETNQFTVQKYLNRHQS